MTDIAALNSEYGIPGLVMFKQGHGGLPFVEIANVHGNAIVALQGGHLTSWTPREEQSVIWLSKDAKFAPNKSIRGGVPVCWPWFGPHARDASFPAHGFARTVPWRVIGAEETSDGGTCLILNLEQNDATRRQWPHACDLILNISVSAALEIELITRNAGATPIIIGEALHTYFEVGDVRDIAIHGLDGCEYLDKVDDGRRKRQVGPVRFSGETDRVYINTVADCLVDDPRLNRRIRIGKRGSRSTVVWNPWYDKATMMGDLGEEGYLNMVCVESANAAENLVTIAPGDEHRLGVSYCLEALPGRHP